MSCIDEIDFDVPSEYQNSTAIVGKIVYGNPASAEVNIQKIFDFSFETEIFATAQEVKLLSESGQELILPLKSTGKYFKVIQEPDEFQVELGGSYALEVKLFDGQHFRSEFEELLAVPPIEDFNVNLIERNFVSYLGDSTSKNKLRCTVDTDLSLVDTDTNIKWEFSNTYKQTDTIGRICYIPDQPDFDVIRTIDRNFLEVLTLDDYDLLELDIFREMTEGYYLKVIQESLTDGALLFWKQIEELSINSGTFYEPPPGQLVTNFKKLDENEGLVFGYFYATQQDSTRIYLDSTLTKLQLTVCPPPPNAPPATGCDHCCDCRILPQSTTEKPDYWIN